MSDGIYVGFAIVLVLMFVWNVVLTACHSGQEKQIKVLADALERERTLRHQWGTDLEGKVYKELVDIKHRHGVYAKIFSTMLDAKAEMRGRR